MNDTMAVETDGTIAKTIERDYLILKISQHLLSAFQNTGVQRDSGTASKIATSLGSSASSPLSSPLSKEIASGLHRICLRLDQIKAEQTTRSSSIQHRPCSSRPCKAQCLPIE